MPQPPKSPKPHPFTEEQIRARAKALWERRGEESTDAENWDDAIRELYRERAVKRVTRPLRRVWWRTGLGTPLQRWWEWTGVKEKKGWDFLQLLVAPVLLGAIALGLQEYVKEHDQKLADAKVQQDQQLADDKAKQDTLVKYLDQMADSLQHGLLKTKPGDDQFIVAQSRTVLALQSLDRTRQHLVVQFLSASGLNDRPDPNWQPRDKQGQPNPLPAKSRVLLYQAQLTKANLGNSDLSGAVLVNANLEVANFGCNPPESRKPDQCSDLRDADLRGADLYRANLSGANLSYADLRGANLLVVNLRGANLWNADLGITILSGADLSGADLSGADLNSADLNSANLNSANLNSAVLLATDLRQAGELTPQQLEGESPPLLCNVALPKGFTVNPNRDCDRIAPVLLKSYQSFKTLKDAEAFVNRLRQLKWTDEPPVK